MSDAIEDWRRWAPDVAAGAAVFGAGLVEILLSDHLITGRDDALWIVLPTATAVALCRRLPGAALVLVWLTGLLQVWGTLEILYVQIAVAAVSFGTARWGRPLTVLASALSIPAAAALAVQYASSDMFAILFGSTRYETLLDTIQQFGPTWQIGAAVFGIALLGVPWLVGLTVRFSSRATESRESQEAAEEQAARARAESEQAREVARLREEQAQLARDVHDVVGHSLAVILAQAESAQFLDEADTGALRLSMANIASSARASLQDVRHVLTSSIEPGAASPGELHDLVENVRASGHEIRLAEVGATRSLAPELATVAYRVLQEMLTNAIRHGRRDTPIEVELHWGGELRIETVNAVAAREETDALAAPGHGLDGMRRRLESIGGRLDVRLRGTDEPTFTATAWLPVRTVYA